MKLNESFMALVAHLTPNFCRTHKKLILVCDMDETLLTEMQDDEKVVLRPKVGFMLRSLRTHYELCMVTYSTRERAQLILNTHLDPESRLFGNRVLCREDIIPQFRNKLDAFLAHLPKGTGKSRRASLEVAGNVSFRPFTDRRRASGGHGNRRYKRPPVWTYVVALDDFPLAWANLSTCIPVRPFLVDNNSRIRAPRNEAAYVLSLHKFLIKLHAAVFREPKQTGIHIEGIDDRLGGCAGSTCWKESPHINSHHPGLSAYAVLTRLRRGTTQSQRFQTLCHLDPGHLIDFDLRPLSQRNPYEQYGRNSPPRQPATSLQTSAAYTSTTQRFGNGIFSATEKLSGVEQMSPAIACDPDNFLDLIHPAKVDEKVREDEEANNRNKLIRHVYKRAKLLREVPFNMGGF